MLDLSTPVSAPKTTDQPVWVAAPIAVSEGVFELPLYYRVALPARITGGSIRSSLTIHQSRWMQIVEGLGPVNVFHVASMPAAMQEMLPRICVALRAEGCRSYVDFDDDPLTGSYQRQEQLTAALIAGVAFDDPRAAQVGAEVVQRRKDAHELLREVLEVADGAIVATDVLAKVLEPLARAVWVAPNIVDPDDVLRVERSGDGVVRIGYAGWRRHVLDDLPIALPGLLECGQLPGVELHFWGCHPRMLESSEVREAGWYDVGGVRYCYHDAIPSMAEYHRSIGCLDIAVAPLAPTSYNRARSPTKWIEHSIHATAMVVSDLEPYAHVEDGVTGLKADSPEEFTEQLLRLAKDVSLRERLGHEAREVVLRHHTTTAQAHRWQRIICG